MSEPEPTYDVTCFECTQCGATRWGGDNHVCGGRLNIEQRQALETVLGLWPFEPTHPVKDPLRKLMEEKHV